MRHCRVHGSYYEGYSGCPDCRRAEERSESALDDLASQLRKAANRDFGDFDCPHCRYQTLRWEASACPACRGWITDDYWEPYRARRREAERQRQLAAERARVESEAFEKKWGWVGPVVFVALITVPLVIFLVIFGLKNPQDWPAIAIFGACGFCAAVGLVVIEKHTDMSLHWMWLFFVFPPLAVVVMFVALAVAYRRRSLSNGAR